MASNGVFFSAYIPAAIAKKVKMRMMKRFRALNSMSLVIIRF